MDTNTPFSIAYPLDILIASGSGLSGVEQLLTHLGYQPGTADNSDDLLRMTSTRRYDLVLVDTRMPGIEAVFSQKKGRPGPWPLFIAVTGTKKADFKQTCLQAMADHRIEGAMDSKEWMLHLKACFALSGKSRTIARD